MATLYTEQERNVHKTWYLMSGFFIVIILLGWAVSVYFGDPSILYFFVAFSIIMNVVSYWNSDKIVLSMSGAHPADPVQHRELINIVENLCITAGLPMPKVYIIQDPAPNAFATGRDEKHAAVAVTTGLMAMMQRVELEGVIAHELGHIQNRDILLQTVVVILVGFITLVSDFLLRATIWGGGNRNRNSGGGFIIMLIIGVVLALLSPFVGKLIQLAISRKREFLADASGALLTRYPEGLASALAKIEGYAGELKRANHATAHLYISNPFREKEGKKISFLAKMFMTHPPTQERIQALVGHTYN
jgi:heat shock protein HtpX